MLYSIEDKTLTALGNTMRKYMGNYVGNKDAEIEPDIIMVLDTREFDGEIRKTSSTSSYDYYDYPCNFNNKWKETEYLLYEIEYETNQLNNFDILLTNRMKSGTLAIASTIVIVKELQGSMNEYQARSTNTQFTDEHYLTLRSYKTINEAYCRATVKIWFCDSNQQKLVPNYYTLPKVIETIDTIGLAPKIILSGGNGAGAFYRFNNGAGAISHQLLLNNPNIFSTKNLSNLNQMFRESTVEYIPFDINLVDNSSSIIATQMFYQCEFLKELPKINGALRPTDAKDIFYVCRFIKSFPDGYFDNWDWGNLHDLTGNKSWTRFIANMYSLEYLPETLIKNYWGGYTSSSSNAYGTLVTKCWHLLECKGLAVSPQTFTSNCFTTDSFNGCYMLGDFTFEVNEDGTPKTANWVNQTIDFYNSNKPIGVLTTSTTEEKDFLQYSDKTTEANKVIDTNTYEAYKGDKYYWTTDINYSRYNHDSAVNTINSLPDCSATGGTNTIKFKGQSGALTDAGAINTLTEEEIAVASAKGWTVSFV